MKLSQVLGKLFVTEFIPVISKDAETFLVIVCQLWFGCTTRNFSHPQQMASHSTFSQLTSNKKNEKWHHITKVRIVKNPFLLYSLCNCTGARRIHIINQWWSHCIMGDGCTSWSSHCIATNNVLKDVLSWYDLPTAFFLYLKSQSPINLEERSSYGF